MITQDVVNMRTHFAHYLFTACLHQTVTWSGKTNARCSSHSRSATLLLRLRSPWWLWRIMFCQGCGEPRPWKGLLHEQLLTNQCSTRLGISALNYYVRGLCSLEEWVLHWISLWTSNTTNKSYIYARFNPRNLIPQGERDFPTHHSLTVHTNGFFYIPCALVIKNITALFPEPDRNRIKI